MVHIIGHRGAPFHAAENTLSAFKRAIELGAHSIELDVRLTKDNVPVVFHDKTLKRLTGAKGWLHRKTWEEVSKLKIGEADRIPRLEEALDLITKDATALLELKPLKSRIAAKKVAEIVSTHPRKDKIFVGSFLPWRLHQVKKVDKDINTAMFFKTLPMAPLMTAKSVKANLILSSKRLLTKRFIDRAHKANLKIGAWTVNSIAEIEALADKGIDAIITDIPDKVSQLFKNKKATKTLL